MKNLKLNKLGKQEMSAAKGGSCYCICGCGCLYANSGGSSIQANGNANKAGNKWSETSVICWNDCGEWVGTSGMQE